jgi:hypothetical protein
VRQNDKGYEKEVQGERKIKSKGHISLSRIIMNFFIIE